MKNKRRTVRACSEGRSNVIAKNRVEIDSRKRCHIIEKSFCNQSPLSSDTSSDEFSDSIVSRDVAYSQNSCFDHLLTLLGPSKQSLTTKYKRQKKVESMSETEEDENEGSRSSGFSYEEQFYTGTKSDSTSSLTGGKTEKYRLSEHEQMNVESLQYEDPVQDALEISDSDDENCAGNNALVVIGDSSSKSHFHWHLNHVLTKAEIDDLTKKAWNYTWERTAFNLSTSKWKGTGDYVLEDEKNNIYGLKLKLFNCWMESYKRSGGCDLSLSRQGHFFSMCNSYRDILHCNKKGFYLKGADEDSSIMDAYIMHVLNHVYRARSLVIKNDNKLSKNPERNEERLHGGSFLDRGFTRPKALILLPFRSIAFRVVKRLIQLSPPSQKTDIEFFDKFCANFGEGNEKDVDGMELSNSTHLKSQNHTKPADFQVLFGGNFSEEFMMGIKYTRKSIKLYADFYSSDIIVASPVQLVQAIGKAEVEKGKDVDYLSSIEVLIIDHADIIAMQNWSHVNSVLEKTNLIPSEQHGSNVMRVRPWYLDGHAHFYRQTIILGSFLNPDISATFNNHCVSYKGKVKSVSEYKGVLPKVLLPVRQFFERFDSSIINADDDRFNYFTKKIFPKIKDSAQGGIMIFLSCYFQFVRIRNFLKSENASFCVLGEYTKQSDISRARGWFFKGERKIMLYTERAHFYHRYKIRGIQSLIFYSLPERKEFYPEIVNMLDGAQNMPCSVLFSRLDVLRLERIVGSTASKKMLLSEKDIFVFC